MIRRIRVFSLIHLFNSALETFSREFRTGYLLELLYIRALRIILESVKKLCQKLLSWKFNSENTGLRVNMKKAKILLSGVKRYTLLYGFVVFAGQVWEAIQFVGMDESSALEFIEN